MLGEKTFAQLAEHELFWQYNTSSNSIAIIVNHLHGNMKSRWTDFLSTDGEKTWRNRDLEFENEIKTSTELLEKWEAGWSCLFNALESIDEDSFETEIYIRNQRHTIVEALNRQMMHYTYHIGQIVYIGRMLKDDNWQSLSIPKNTSNSYNAAKFALGKHGGHFTDGK